MTLDRIDARCSAPLLSVAQIRDLERSTAMTSASPLMVLAGLSVARLARALAPHACRIWVACGPGNNGGDGLEAARHLHQDGREVHVSLLADPDWMSPDARDALQRAQASGVPLHTDLPLPWLQELGPEDLAIDALLGLGASRAAEGALLQAIQMLQSTQARVLAVDLPSGLMPDTGEADPARCVRADHTLCLLALKPGLLTAQGRDTCGQLWLDDLGAQIPAHLKVAEINTPSPLADRRHASHKGVQGDVAVIGGDSGMLGASILAAEAALHAGAGRVFWCPLSADRPSLALPADLMQREVSQLPLNQLSVACGCGGGRAVREVLAEVIRRSARLVLDADALNAVAADPWLQDLLAQRLPTATVLTPHPLEAARLLECSVKDIQHNRLAAAETLCARFGGCVTVLKGSGSIIAGRDRTTRVNPSGNARLATGGTGDVLAGLIAARLNHLPDAFEAACTAVWEHGNAADRWPEGSTLTAQALARSLQAARPA